MQRCRLPVRGSKVTVGVCGALIAGALQASAQAGPSFSKVFSPSTVGPGGVSTLSFTIDNSGSGSPLSELAFTDTLPAGVLIAAPAMATSSCGGTLTAPAGGSTLSFNGGVLGAFSTCTIMVDVTSSAAGTHLNVSGALTSSAGTVGGATALLTVDTSRPGFSKSFAPSTVARGARSTLTFTIDNTASQSQAARLRFADQLPRGMVVAGPANVSSSCNGGLITAVPGSSSFAYSYDFLDPSSGRVAAGASCTVTVDVIALAVGTLDNRSGELSSGLPPASLSSGRASATLEVTAEALSITKSFNNDPVNPGSTVTLEFTISNFDRESPATAVSFTDDLGAALPGLVATGLPATDVCGAGSTLSGTSLLTLIGGSLAAEGSCAFSVTLQVPTAAAAGAYVNTTSTITAEVGGTGVSGSPATESLFVTDAPVLTKTFLSDPIGTGDTVTVEFTITNTSTTSAATDIAFTDNVSAFLSGTTVTALPPGGSCGAGSTFSLTQVVGDLVVSVAGGQLAAGDTCTFEVDFLIPPGTLPGPAVNATSEISATIDGLAQTGGPATDTLTVVGAPRLRKTFSDDPVAAGGTVTLEFTIDHSDAAPDDAIAISFTDDLGAMLAGATALGLPAADVCGAGSILQGTTDLSLTGATLVPGTACTFDVTVQVPAAAIPGTYANLSSPIEAIVSGVATTGLPAAADLRVSGLDFSKEFVDDPVIPGGTATLRFTITNTTADLEATGMAFTDSLNGTLSGLAASAPLPATPCGAGSALTGTSTLIFSGGDLAAGETCSFDVTVAVPGSAGPGSHENTTSYLVATIGGSPAVLRPATDRLEVSGDRLSLEKDFVGDRVALGGTVALRFTLSNLDPAAAATGIAFTDDLEAALAGLEAVGLPSSDICGAGSQVTGTGLLTFTGGSLPAGGECTFDVTIQVPAGPIPGGPATNITSQVTGAISGLPVTGAPARDDLLVNSAALSKSFAGTTPAGGSVLLSFTLENLSSTDTAGGLSFLDDLEAMLPGATAVGLPTADVCGPGSTLEGTSVISLRGGVLGPGASCSFSVEVAIPAGAAPGSYVNTTSGISAAGTAVGEPAAATIDVSPAAAAAAIPAQTTPGLLMLVVVLVTCGFWLLRGRVV